MEEIRNSDGTTEQVENTQPLRHEPVQTPAERPDEGDSYDEDEAPDAEEKDADFDAEEQNPKETSA